MAEQQYTEEQVQAEIEFITQGYSPASPLFEDAIAEGLRQFYGYQPAGLPAVESMAARAATRPNSIVARRYPVVAEAVRRIEAMRSR